MVAFSGTPLSGLKTNVMASDGAVQGVTGDGMARVIPAGRLAQIDQDWRINLWNARATQWDQYFQLFQPDIVRNWRWYRAWKQPLSEPLDWWRANEVIPTCFKIIETLLPKYIFGLFDSPDWFTVKGTEPMDEIWELAIASLLKEKLEEMHVIPTFIEALKYATITGHVWGKVTWLEEWQQRQILQPKVELDPVLGTPTGRSGFTKTTVTNKITDRPDFQWVNLDRLKTATDGSGRWYIEEMQTTLEQLIEEDERVGDLYQNLNQVTSLMGSTVGSDPGFREPQNTEGTPQWHVEHKDGTPVTLWQCWGWIPPQYRNKNESEWRLQVIANRRVVIRDVDAPTPTGKPPYFGIKCVPIPGRLLGESILRYIGPLQDQQTRLSNMRLEEVMLTVWGQMIIDSNAGITNNELMFQPGGVLFVNGNPTEKVMVFPRKPIDPATFQEDNYRQSQAEHAAGATDIMEGVNNNDRSTAQEIQTKLAQSGMRVTSQVMWFEETVKKPLLTRTYEWLQMRMSNESVQRVIGSDGIIYNVPMNIQNIQIPIDITVGGGLLGMSKAMQAQNFQEMIGIAGSPVLGPYMRPGAILQRYYKTKGITNVDAYVKSDEEVMAQMSMGMAPSGLGSGQPSTSPDQGGAGTENPNEPAAAPSGQQGPGMASQPGPPG